MLSAMQSKQMTSTQVQTNGIYQMRQVTTGEWGDGSERKEWKGGPMLEYPIYR